MTLREKLADWISGGAVTRERGNVRFMKERRDFWSELHQAALDYVGERNRQNAHLRATLERIAAMETPGANATVRNMAKLAREALE